MKLSKMMKLSPMITSENSLKYPQASTEIGLLWDWMKLWWNNSGGTYFCLIIQRLGISV